MLDDSPYIIYLSGCFGFWNLYFAPRAGKEKSQEQMNWKSNQMCTYIKDNRIGHDISVLIFSFNYV